MVRVVRAIVEIAVCVCLLPIYFRFYLVGASALDSDVQEWCNWLLDSASMVNWMVGHMEFRWCRNSSKDSWLWGHRVNVSSTQRNHNDCFFAG